MVRKDIIQVMDWNTEIPVDRFVKGVKEFLRPTKAKFIALALIFLVCFLISFVTCIGAGFPLALTGFYFVLYFLSMDPETLLGFYDSNAKLNLGQKFMIAVNFILFLPLMITRGFDKILIRIMTGGLWEMGVADYRPYDVDEMLGFAGLEAAVLLGYWYLLSCFIVSICSKIKKKKGRG